MAARALGFKSSIFSSLQRVFKPRVLKEADGPQVRGQFQADADDGQGSTGALFGHQASKQEVLPQVQNILDMSGWLLDQRVALRLTL
jgi:hypothetical protein